MKKTLRKILSALLALVLTFALGFGAGCVWLRWRQTRDALPVMGADSGLRLPGEAEKRIVMRDDVKARLAEIGELATYMGEYTVTKSVDTTRTMFGDIPIFGTTNSITLTCGGVVKLGYALDGILPRVDNDAQTIAIELPAPVVLDNYVIWDTVEYAEKNNILNPITFAQYQTLLAEIEQEGLAEAESQGLYAKAEENAQHIIRNFLSPFEDYTIIFT